MPNGLTRRGTTSTPSVHTNSSINRGSPLVVPEEDDPSPIPFRIENPQRVQKGRRCIESPAHVPALGLFDRLSKWKSERSAEHAHHLPVDARLRLILDPGDISHFESPAIHASSVEVGPIVRSWRHGQAFHAGCNPLFGDPMNR